MSLSEMIMKNDENLGNSFEAEEEVKQDEKQIEQNFVDNFFEQNAKYPVFDDSKLGDKQV